MSDQPLLNPAQLKAIQASTEQAVADFIRNIPNIVRTNLTNSIMQMIGFREKNFHGRWEMDCCNGRSSIVSEFIKEESAKEVRTALLELLPDTLEQLRTDEKFKEATSKAFMETYKRHLTDEIRNQAQTLAKTDATKLVHALSSVRLDQPLVNTELADPASYAGALGEATLERVLQRCGLIQIGDALPPDPAPPAQPANYQFTLPDAEVYEE